LFQGFYNASEVKCCAGEEEIYKIKIYKIKICIIPGLHEELMIKFPEDKAAKSSFLL
jgi:hypothetical protein